MRIIAGEHRGRRLKTLEGLDTRPTIDRARESLMSVIVSARGGMEGAVVLDAFAGSGALGLEALSRGAASVQFFDQSRDAVRIVSDNVKTLGYEPRQARVNCADVLANPPKFARPPFDLVFLDPPYKMPAQDVIDLIGRLDHLGVLAQGVLITYEHDAKASASVDELLATSAFALRSRRTYGKTIIDIIEREGE